MNSSWQRSSTGIVPRRLGTVSLGAGAIMLALVALAGCSKGDDQPAPAGSGAGIANPASEYCVAQGGTVEIVTGDAGDQGFCNLPDGTRVDEWEYYRANNGEDSDKG